MLLFTSYLVKLAPRRLDSIRGFFRILLIMAPLIGLVAWENFSTALVTGVILVSICFVSSRKKGYYLWGLLALVAVFALLIIFFPYRGERFDIWMDIENHPKGYQILQGLYAIASGGLFPVADKRQRNTRGRYGICYHGDIDQHLHGNMRHNSRRNQATKRNQRARNGSRRK